MTIEFRFQSVSIQPADLQENYLHIFSAFQPYLTVQQSVKRRPRKKRKTVAHVIDNLIDNIDRMK